MKLSQQFLSTLDSSVGSLILHSFRRSNENLLILVHIYMDDITFGSTDQVMVDDFANHMTS